MWTKKAHILVVYIRINRFRLPIIMPALILNSLITELCDLVNFFTFFNSKITAAVKIAETTIHSITDFEKIDLLDLSVNSGKDNDKVEIKIYTR